MNASLAYLVVTLMMLCAAGLAAFMIIEGEAERKRKQSKVQKLGRYRGKR